jgi:hypothetical protein
MLLEGSRHALEAMVCPPLLAAPLRRAKVAAEGDDVILNDVEAMDRQRRWDEMIRRALADLEPGKTLLVLSPTKAGIGRIKSRHYPAIRACRGIVRFEVPKDRGPQTPPPHIIIDDLMEPRRATT